MCTMLTTYVASLFSIMIASCNAASYTLQGQGTYKCLPLKSTEDCSMEVDGSASNSIINCNQAATCTIECGASAADKALQGVVINAQDSNQLILRSSQSECFKFSTINVPQSGNAYLYDAPGSKTYSLATINAGANTQNIYVECNGGAGNDCRALTVNANTAQYVQIVVGNASMLNTGVVVNCPQNSNYQGPEMAPCIIDVTGGGIMDAVTMNTLNGVPADLWIKGTDGQDPFDFKDSVISCSSLSKSTDIMDSDLTVLPLTLSDLPNCWNAPTQSPTNDPTRAPSRFPSRHPSAAPTGSPSRDPSRNPSLVPTQSPTNDPTKAPSRFPTRDPSAAPTGSPSDDPTRNPSLMPSSRPTADPSGSPADFPTSSPPTASPSSNPSVRPTVPPTRDPSEFPTLSPTDNPTRDPSEFPSASPSSRPSVSPTIHPNENPTRSPTPSPTSNPTINPTTRNPTLSPSITPSLIPTETPTRNPSEFPTSASSRNPTNNPTSDRTRSPTDSPTISSPSSTRRPSVPRTAGPTRSRSQSPTESSANVDAPTMPTRTSTRISTVIPSTAARSADSASMMESMEQRGSLWIGVALLVIITILLFVLVVCIVKMQKAKKEHRESVKFLDAGNDPVLVVNPMFSADRNGESPSTQAQVYQATHVQVMAGVGGTSMDLDVEFGADDDDDAASIVPRPALQSVPSSSVHKTAGGNLSSGFHNFQYSEGINSHKIEMAVIEDDAALPPVPQSHQTRGYADEQEDDAASTTDRDQQLDVEYQRETPNGKIHDDAASTNGSDQSLEQDDDAASDCGRQFKSEHEPQTPNGVVLSARPTTLK